MSRLSDFLFYEEPGITLYCGDCRVILPLLRCPNTSYCLEACDGRCGGAALVLTDPPYETEAHTLQRRVKRAGGVMAIEALPFAQIDAEIRADFCGALAGLARRWVLVFCQAEAVSAWRTALEGAGIHYRRPMVWIKPDAMPQYSGDRPSMGHESIVAAWAGKGKSIWNGGGRAGVFHHPKNDPYFDDGRAAHPTQKPGPLIRELIELFSSADNLVLDPFAGSGTTLRAAKDLGRRAIGIEIEPKYCEIAVKRLRQEVLPLA